MDQRYKPARQFSNGSEADHFQCTFCDRCDKGVNCKPQKLIDAGIWPVGDVLAMDVSGRHVCLDFFSEDREIQGAYENAVPQEYIGYMIRNLQDGYSALNDNGETILRCGSKERLETMLLIIHADKTPKIQFDAKDVSTDG